MVEWLIMAEIFDDWTNGYSFVAGIYNAAPLCEDILLNGSQVFQQILLICNRNECLGPPRRNTKFGVDQIPKSSIHNTV